MTRYTGFSLQIESQIDLPFLEISTTPQAPADITITIGAVPEAVNAPTLTAKYFQRSADQFLFRLPGFGTFWVEQGRAITVASEGDNAALLRLLLLDTVLPALLYQRGLMVFWGACIDTPNGAVLLANYREGNGVSTLTAAMLQHQAGSALISDGFVAARVDDTGVLALPASRYQMLWKDSIEQLGMTTGGLTPVRPDAAEVERFFVPAPAYCAEPRPLRRIYLLSTLEAAPAERLKGIRMIQNLSPTLYHPSFAHADLMPLLLMVARHTEVYLLHRGRSWNRWDLPALTQLFDESLAL